MANEIKAQELVTGTNELAKALADIAKQIANVREEMTKAQKAFDSRSKTQSDLAKKSRELSTVDKELIKLDKQMATAEAKLTNEYKQVAKATLQKKEAARLANEELKKQLGISKQAQAEERKLAAERKKAAVANFNNITKTKKAYSGLIKSLGTVAGAYLGIQTAIRAVKGAFNTIRDFTKENAVLAGVLGKTREETKALADEAIRLGAVYPVTAQEVLALETAYARLGFTQEQILDLTESTIQGAIALNAAQEDTATLVGAVVRAFDNLNATDAGQIIDTLSASTQKSSLDFEKLATALPKVAGAANAMGIPLETVAAQLSIAQDATQDASIAGTSLRNIYLELSKKGLTLNEALGQINNSQNKLTTANELFGKRAAITALALANNIGKTEELDIAYQNAGGTAERVAKEQMATLDGAIKGLASAYESLILSFKNSEGGLSTIINFFTSLLRNHAELTDVIKDNFGAFTDLGSAIGELLTMLGIVNDEAKEGSSIMKVWGVVARVVSAPVRLLAKGITFLVEQLTALVEKLQPAIDKLKTFAGIVGNVVGFIKDKIGITNDEIVEDSKEKTDELIEEEERLVEAVEESNDKIIESSKNKYKELLKNAKKFGADLKAENAAAAQQYVDSLGLFESELQASIDNELRLEDEALKASMQSQDDARQAASQEDIDLAVKVEEKKKELKSEAAQAAASIVTGIYSAGVDERLAKFSDGEEAKQDALKIQLEQELITEDQYEKRLAASKLKVRQEEAKAEKKKALFEIAIATAVAAVQALPALPLVALVLALGAIQAAVVASKPLPQYEDGEVNISANRHSQGGKDINIEGGESIINRTGTSNAPNLLEYINSGLIKDSDLLPSSGKMFSGADTKELLKGNEGSVINLKPLVEGQKEMIRAVKAKNNVPSWTKDGLKEFNERGIANKNRIDKWMR